MALLLLLRVLPLWLCALLTVADGLHVERLPLQPSPGEPLPEDTVGTVQQLQWIVRGGADERLEELQLGLLSQVYVSHLPAAADDQLATIRLLALDDRSLGAFDVTPVVPNGVEFRPLKSLSAEFNTWMRAEVIVHRVNSIQRVRVDGSGDVIVEKDVLVRDDPSLSMLVETKGSGDLYMLSQPSIRLASMSTLVSGSGDVNMFLDGGSVALDTLSILSTGSGDFIAAGAQPITVTRNMSTIAQGSGSVCIDSPWVDLTRITVFSGGSGDISIGRAGTCDAELCSVMGSGDIYVAPLQCIDAGVELYGSGDAMVQANRSISGHRLGSGNIKYVGEGPLEFMDKRTSSTGKIRPIAKPTHASVLRPCTLPIIPEKQLEKIHAAFIGTNRFLELLTPFL
ncbi:hypothetical protein P43SY_004573 [Pythium insidiosum]|uniref:Putative auto-transporter adhesin head GIN domain-containing protein n=1 Tax=Pythium insidiosum TaxID=114742 RepID=A0AAD5M9C1_PYTIN|nr:hypothetical protein P43SY_004573 [Pythium insidiosum]